jgi:hypothetical protein
MGELNRSAFAGESFNCDRAIRVLLQSPLDFQVYSIGPQWAHVNVGMWVETISILLDSVSTSPYNVRTSTKLYMFAKGSTIKKTCFIVKLLLTLEVDIEIGKSVPFSGTFRLR